MRFTKPLAAVAVLALLGACAQGYNGSTITPDAQRAAAGAVAGAIVAKALDENVAAGAAVGATAGALCDDAGVCTQ